jgi:branched-chain amino acid transport system substrate-binding protein
MQRKTMSRAVAALLGLSLVAAACGGDDSETTETTAAPAGGTETTAASGGGEGGVTCEGIKLAFMGALSGDNGALGQNMVDGAQLAIDEFNAANPNCQVAFGDDTKFDSQGDPAQATPLADQVVGDTSIIGLIGPGFSGETRATLPKFEAAGLAMITPGATNAKLPCKDEACTEFYTVFHRVLANDDKQAPGVVKLITETLGSSKVGVIDDASTYGKGLADSVRAGLGANLLADATIDPNGDDYSTAITAMTNAGVDTVFYGGYFAEAGKLVKQMRDAGLADVTFVSGDGSLDVGFIEAGGPAAEGTYLTATGAPADINPEFQAAFNAKYGKDPTLYAPEAYDVAKVFLAAIEAGNTDRASVLAFIETYDAPGITKNIKWDDKGEPEGDAVFYYVVEGGALVAKGTI